LKSSNTFKTHLEWFDLLWLQLLSIHLLVWKVKICW